MAKVTRKQKDFIRSNLDLGAKALSDKTGLDIGEIQRVVNEIKLQAVSAQIPVYSPLEFKLNDSGIWLSSLAILIITILVYIPSLDGEFVNWDDAWVLTENTSIHSLNWDSLRWMFTSLDRFWLPLTWLSHAIIYHYWKLDPSAHHMANVLIHCANAALVFILSLRILSLGSSVLVITESPKSQIIFTAAFAALLFAIHPTHVESVAWVTERKDVLYGFFYLLSMLAYLSYQADGNKSGFKYALCMVYFICSLMSKSMAMTLPLTLLILDFWPLSRVKIKNIRQIIIEKIPFIILSIPVALLAQKSQILAENEFQAETLKFSMFTLMNAFNSMIFYISKTILPIDLSPLYPVFDTEGKKFSTGYIFSLLMVLIISYASYQFGGKKRPYLLAAWLYYVITVIPTLYLTRMASAVAADRFTYLPTFSLLLLFAGFGSTLYAKASQRSITRPALIAGSILMLVGLGYASVKQTGVWKNSIVLWETVAKLFPDVTPTIYSALGDAYNKAGKIDEGISNFKRAIAISPDMAEYHYQVGLLFMKKGLYETAMNEFQKTVEINPKYINAHSSLGLAYFRLGKYDEAIPAYRQALANNPKEPHIVHDQFANVFLLKGSYEEAIQEYKQAIKFNPKYANAYGNLGTAYMKAGKLDEALDSFRQAVTINPGVSHIIHDQYGNTLLLKGLPKEAIQEFQKAVDLEPTNVNSWQNLWGTYENLEMSDEALATAQKSVKIVPGFADGFRNLGISYERKKLFKESEGAFQKALALIPNNPEYTIHLASSYHVQGKTEQAIEICQNALRSNPNRADVMITLSNFYIDKNRLKEAIHILQIAIGLSPNEPIAYNNLGVAYEKSGQKDLAIQNYEQAVKVNPQFNPAHANLARLYASNMTAKN